MFYNTYTTNMAESTKRWNQISEHLDDIDINYSRFDEIDGRNMSPVKIITVATIMIVIIKYYRSSKEIVSINNISNGRKWTTLA